MSLRGQAKKERVGQHTLPAAELDALAGQELVTERHLGSPRSVGELETACAMLTAIAVPHSLSPRSSTAAVHCSGAELDTRPLQFNWQFTDEPNEMSSAVCLSTNEPTSYTILQDMRGYDPGAAVTSLSTNEPRRPLNNEHITPENLAQPHYSTYDAESVSQCIDVTGRTIVDCAQQIFSMTATERMEGERSPQIAMKRCLCPGTPDPPTHLASATMHKKGLRAVARLNWGAPFAGADIIKRVGGITATNATVALDEWDASLREMSSQLSNLAKLRKFVRIDGARTKSGAPMAGD